jgi:hemolysin activation/secretion protein
MERIKKGINPCSELYKVFSILTSTCNRWCLAYGQIVAVRSILLILIFGGVVIITGFARAQDQLPQQSTSGSPSSNPLPTSTSDQASDVTLTPENPVSSNPLPPIPKLELNSSEQVAPVLPALNPNENSTLFEPQIFVKAYVFTGNTVFDSSTLARLLDKYTGRKITSDELEAARQTVTLYYVSHGYINSGAILPDQDPKDGVIHLQIVEGKLTTVEIKGNHWFQTWWLRNEMRFAAGEPLNFNSLKEGMQVLRENPTIAQVNAELQPGGAPGESQLEMEVKDKQPFRFSVEINNYRPPSVGSTIAEAHLSDLNLTGNNDPLLLTYGIATTTPGGWEWSDFDNAGADYRFPVSPWRTTMEIGADKNNSGILAAPFNQLDIVSKLTEYHVAVHQPIFETPKRSLILTFEVDSRRSETFLFGQPFTLSPGAANGVEDVFVPRFIQEFVDRSQVHVFSFRSQFSLGIDAYRATINDGAPDGHFFDWLGQTQYIRRLGDTDNLIIARLSGQIADRPLLSLEQLELGGISSVRGYLENQALTDNGLIASLEFRIPVWEDKDHNSLVSLAPFSDFGVGWNNVVAGSASSAGTTGTEDRDGVTLPSVGIGFLANPVKYVSGQIYYGYGFNRRQVPDGDSLQNQGVEFSISFNAL